MRKYMMIIAASLALYAAPVAAGSNLKTVLKKELPPAAATRRRKSTAGEPITRRSATGQPPNRSASART